MRSDTTVPLSRCDVCQVARKHGSRRFSVFSNSCLKFSFLFHACCDFCTVFFIIGSRLTFFPAVSLSFRSGFSRISSCLVVASSANDLSFFLEAKDQFCLGSFGG